MHSNQWDRPDTCFWWMTSDNYSLDCSRSEIILIIYCLAREQTRAESSWNDMHVEESREQNKTGKWADSEIDNRTRISYLQQQINSQLNWLLSHLTLLVWSLRSSQPSSSSWVCYWCKSSHKTVSEISALHDMH